MIFYRILVLMLTLFAPVTALVYLLAGRKKGKLLVPAKALWIFKLLQKIFEENDSSTKEVKENGMP
jgi:hypothetical protein